MNLKDKVGKFNRRWNIQSNIDPIEEFKKFKIRILNIFIDIDSHVPDETVSAFCRIVGIPEQFSEYMTENPRNIYCALVRENDPVQFYKLLEIIFALEIYRGDGRYTYGPVYSKERLYDLTAEAVTYSDLNLACTISNGEVIFYPKGEEVLDDVLVNETLSFLNKESNKHFIEALEFYKTKKWIKCSEALRRAVEEFLRFKLKNKNGLAVNIIEVGKSLKNENVPAQARNVVVQVLGYLNRFFNENSKHNDGDLGDEDAEFLIYQVGLLMRYLYKCLK